MKEKLERMPGDVAFMAAASSPTDCGAGTGSMIGRGVSSVGVNKNNAKCQTSKKNFNQGQWTMQCSLLPYNGYTGHSRLQRAVLEWNLRSILSRYYLPFFSSSVSPSSASKPHVDCCENSGTQFSINGYHNIFYNAKALLHFKFNTSTGKSKSVDFNFSHFPQEKKNQTNKHTNRR